MVPLRKERSRIAFDFHVLKRICGSKKLLNEKHRSVLFSLPKANKVKSKTG